MRERPLLRLETAMLGNTRILLILDSQIFYKSITIDNPAGDAGEPDKPTRWAGISSMLDSVIDKNASTGGAHCSDAEIDTLGLQSGFSLIPSKLTPVFFSLCGP